MTMNGFLILIFTNFTGFNSLSEGGIVFIESLEFGNIMINNINIANCSSNYSLFYFLSSNKNILTLISLTKIEGRVFKVSQKSNINIDSLTIKENSCMNSIMLQSGCVFYLESDSSIYISNSTIHNVSNAKSPGAFYAENSNMTFFNFSLTNVRSEVGLGCLYGVNVYLKISNCQFTEFINGCIELQESFALINSSKFTNYRVTNKETIYASIIKCSQTFKLSIINCTFDRNKNNSLKGGVIFYKITFLKID